MKKNKERVMEWELQRWLGGMLPSLNSFFDKIVISVLINKRTCCSSKIVNDKHIETLKI